MKQELWTSRPFGKEKQPQLQRRQIQSFLGVACWIHNHISDHKSLHPMNLHQDHANHDQHNHENHHVLDVDDNYRRLVLLVSGTDIISSRCSLKSGMSFPLIKDDMKNKSFCLDNSFINVICYCTDQTYLFTNHLS
jgi:hypothetical protein